VDTTDPENPKKVDYVEGATTIDITAMKADKFIPGCASAEPKIEFQLTKVAEDIAFNLPEGLKVEDVPDHLRLAGKVQELGINAALYSIVNNTPGASKAQGLLGGVVSKETAAELIAEHPKLKQTLESNLKSTDTKSIPPKAKPSEGIHR
jgi:hypothetical protein